MPDNTEVEVWDYRAQQFIPSIRCPGEKRVRVDVFGEDWSEGLAVFEVRRDPDASGVFYPIDGSKPLKDWRIDLS